MKTSTIQIQKQSESRLDKKLDKITSLLEMLVQIQVEEEYPPESKMKRSFIRRAEKLLAELKSGKLKMVTYKNFADFDRSMG
ncbi:Uncharacterised protein [uncultured archaeon]|nr:Uncharacterised protein [uncultured archaeon]